jgi:hypothetical protein
MLAYVLMAALASADAAPPAALAAVVEGPAWRTAPATAARQPLGPLDWIPAGSALEAGPAGRIVVVFASGARFELAGGARAVVTAEGLGDRRGPVKELARVPALPALPALAVQDPPGPRAGAIRIRGARIEELYPATGAATLADHTVLRFARVAGAPAYRVAVEDAAGRPVFEVETSVTTVGVPAGTLRPGEPYAWTVRTVGTLGSPARGEAEFATVASEAAAAREALRAAVAADRSAAPMLAEVDRALGLWLEARDAMDAAAAAAPADAALSAAAERMRKGFEERFGSAGPPGR